MTFAPSRGLHSADSFLCVYSPSHHPYRASLDSTKSFAYSKGSEVWAITSRSASSCDRPLVNGTDFHSNRQFRPSTEEAPGLCGEILRGLGDSNVVDDWLVRR